MVSDEEAEHYLNEKYFNGKKTRNLNFSLQLYKDFRKHCIDNETSASHRIAVLIAKDLLEYEK